MRSFPTWLNLRDDKDDGDGESKGDMWDEEMNSENYDSGEKETDDATIHSCLTLEFPIWAATSSNTILSQARNYWQVRRIAMRQAA